MMNNLMLSAKLVLLFQIIHDLEKHVVQHSSSQDVSHCLLL